MGAILQRAEADVNGQKLVFFKLIRFQDFTKSKEVLKNLKLLVLNIYFDYTMPNFDPESRNLCGK